MDLINQVKSNRVHKSNLLYLPSDKMAIQQNILQEVNSVLRCVATNSEVKLRVEVKITSRGKNYESLRKARPRS